MSSDLNLYSIGFQDNIRSKPVRENFTDIQNNFNLLRAEVYASISATASEVTTARGGFSTLVENVNIRDYGVSTGGIVEQQTVANNTVKFSAGSGACPDGSGVKWTAGNSGTIGAITKPRYGVALINNDSSFSIEWGATASSPTIPSTTLTQMPLATVYQGTASPAVISTANITDSRFISNKTQLIKSERTISQKDLTQAVLFTALDSYIPKIGNTAIINGCVWGFTAPGSVTIAIPSYIIRISSTIMHIYYIDVYISKTTPSTTPQYLTITSGSASLVSGETTANLVSLAW